jgi:hypothetical protein
LEKGKVKSPVKAKEKANRILMRTHTLKEKEKGKVVRKARPTRPLVRRPLYLPLTPQMNGQARNGINRGEMAGMKEAGIQVIGVAPIRSRGHFMSNHTSALPQ